MILIRCICPHVNVCHNSHLCALQMMISLMKMKKGIFKKDRSVVKVNIPQFCDCIFIKSIPSMYFQNLAAAEKRSLVSEKSASKREKKILSNRQKKGIENIMGQTKKDMILVWSVEERDSRETFPRKSPR